MTESLKNKFAVSSPEEEEALRELEQRLAKKDLPDHLLTEYTRPINEQNIQAARTRISAGPA